MSKGVDPHDLKSLYVRYAPVVRRRCRHILGDDSLADDALQEVFVKLMRYGADTSDPKRTLGWFNRVAQRCCFDLISKRRCAPQPALTQNDPPCGEQPFADRAADRDFVMTILAGLKERGRAVAVMYYVDELEQEEIAAKLGCTRRTVYQDLQRIKKRADRLQRQLRSLP